MICRFWKTAVRAAVLAALATSTANADTIMNCLRVAPNVLRCSVETPKGRSNLTCLGVSPGVIPGAGPETFPGLFHCVGGGPDGSSFGMNCVGGPEMVDCESPSLLQQDWQPEPPRR
jgi:hypothetical protein